MKMDALQSMFYGAKNHAARVGLVVHAQVRKV